MGDTVHSRLLDGVHLDRGPPRRVAGGRARALAPMQVAGSALIWVGLVAAITAVILAAVLTFSSIIHF